MKRIRLHCLIGNLGHVPSTTPYEACDVPESGAEINTDGMPEYQSRVIDFSQFQDERGGMSTNGSKGSFGGRLVTTAHV